MTEVLSREQTHLEVREAFRIAGLRTTTWEDFQNMIRGLALVLTKCPEDCRSLVESAIVNAERRAFYVGLKSEL